MHTLCRIMFWLGRPQQNYFTTSREVAACWLAQGRCDVVSVLLDYYFFCQLFGCCAACSIKYKSLVSPVRLVRFEKDFTWTGCWLTILGSCHCVRCRMYFDSTMAVGCPSLYHAVGLRALWMMLVWLSLEYLESGRTRNYVRMRGEVDYLVVEKREKRCAQFFSYNSICLGKERSDCSNNHGCYIMWHQPRSWCNFVKDKFRRNVA